MERQGQEALARLKERLTDFREKCRCLSEIYVPGKEIIGSFGVWDLDESKIVMMLRHHLASGKWLLDYLRSAHKLEMELRLKQQEIEIKNKEQEIRQNNEVMLEALSSLVEFRNIEIGEHTQRIKYFTKIILEYMQEYFPKYGLDKDRIDGIVRACVLHDIGKIGIPDAILLKPGRLTEEEFEIMKTHTTIGCEILKR